MARRESLWGESLARLIPRPDVGLRQEERVGVGAQLVRRASEYVDTIAARGADAGRARGYLDQASDYASRGEDSEAVSAARMAVLFARGGLPAKGFRLLASEGAGLLASLELALEMLDEDVE